MNSAQSTNEEYQRAELGYQWPLPPQDAPFRSVCHDNIADIERDRQNGSMSKLALRYKYDPSHLNRDLVRDDFGYLTVAVETPDFSGRGGFWVQWQDVIEFAEALGAYPITNDAPVGCQWGYEMQEGDDLILRIEIKPTNLRGDLAVHFEVADMHEAHKRMRGSFLTNYPEIAAFRADITRLMDMATDEAVLTGR